ncbi:hypothetical protein BTVI_125736 [Pitangus sulphuratus]|nr:hypothetical protein BTVI_125736 [Pitangus sulphuratus]
MSRNALAWHKEKYKQLGIIGLNEYAYLKFYIVLNEEYNPIKAIKSDISRREQDKGPQAVVKIIKTEDYKAMDMPVPSIKY